MAQELCWNFYRTEADDPADSLVSHYLAGADAGELYRALRAPVREAAAPRCDISNFLLTPRPDPAWLNEKAVRCGRSLFQKYTSSIMGVLGAYSLPFCYAASPGNKALFLADKMRQSPGKRLLDTAEFVLAVCQPRSADAVTYAINRTRLIHAVARWHVRQRGWNSAWGEPINQEDMAGTNLAFSYLVLLGLQQLGVQLTVTEKEAYLHLWRYIGYRLYIAEPLLAASWVEARWLAQQIKKRQIRPSEEGMQLTRELVLFYKQATQSSHTGWIEAQLQWFLGKEVASYVGICASESQLKAAAVFQQLQTLANLLGVRLPGAITATHFGFTGGSLRKAYDTHL